MTMRFEGLSDSQWELFEPLLPQGYKPGNRGVGRPPVNFRWILNTILWVLFEGAKWKSVPVGPTWGSKSASHRWLGKWFEDGTWKRLTERFLAMADLMGLVNLDRGSVDGMFVPGKGGGDDVAYGYKGKGSTLHHLCDNNGRTLGIKTTPANIDERSVVEALLDSFAIRNGKRGRPKKRLRALQGDKGYESRELAERLRSRGVRPMISQKKRARRRPGRPPAPPIDRFKIERSHSWLQRRFRRLCVKWERRGQYWHGLVLLAIGWSWVLLILENAPRIAFLA